MTVLRDRSADFSWTKERFEETFGARLPGRFHENWPKDKRICVLLTFDTQGDVDAAVPGYQSCRWPGGAINYCDLTMRQYDILEGLPRVLRILDKYSVKATFPLCGRTAEWYPHIVADIMDRDHEIAVHGYHHIPMFELSPEEQRAEIARATDAVAAATGQPPKGWRSPIYSITEYTLDYLRDFGYVWDSDFHDQNFPYVLKKNGREIVEIPATLDDWGLYLQLGGDPIDAIEMGGTPYGNPEGVFSTLKAEFDILYEESAQGPRVFQWGMHPKISGRPFRAAVLDRLIAYVKKHDGVWFATCEELARLHVS